MALTKPVVMARFLIQEFFQFEINGLAVYADNGDMTARFHDVLAHIPSRRNTDGFDGTIYAVFADNGKNLFGDIA